MTISVIVMAFNEADNLESVIKEIEGTLDGIALPAEIVVINDGSSDRTGVIADQLAKELARVRVIHHEINQGLGEVYRTGFASARGEVITFFPADGQFPAEIIAQFFPLMGQTDLVLGYLPDRDDPLLAKALSRARGAVNYLLFGNLPRFQGIFMVRRAILNELTLKSQGRAATVVYELIIRATRGKYRTVSTPTEMRPRLSGQSKVNNWRTIRANIQQVWELRRSL